MRAWPVQDAKARFSEMLETCLREGRRSSPNAAPKLPSWCRRRIGGDSNAQPSPTLKELLLTDDARGELDIPARGGRRGRQVRGLN